MKSQIPTPAKSGQTEQSTPTIPSNRASSKTEYLPLAATPLDTSRHIAGHGNIQCYIANAALDEVAASQHNLLRQSPPIPMSKDTYNYIKTGLQDAWNEVSSWNPACTICAMTGKHVACGGS